MIKKFYIFAWFLLAGSILFSVLNGPLNALQMLTFSLLGVGLVYAFLLWAVIVTPAEAERE